MAVAATPEAIRNAEKTLTDQGFSRQPNGEWRSQAGTLAVIENEMIFVPGRLCAMISYRAVTG